MWSRGTRPAPRSVVAHTCATAAATVPGVGEVAASQAGRLRQLLNRGTHYALFKIQSSGQTANLLYIKTFSYLS